MKYLLNNANVFIDDRFVRKNVFVENGSVSSVSDAFPPVLEGVSVFDFNNCFVFPGFVDVHVHLREPGFFYKETIKSGTLAAAHGGFTSICSMPNLDPVPDSLENLKAQTDIIERDAQVRVYPYGSITKGEKQRELSDMEKLAPYVIAFSDDGVGVQSYEMMEQAMKKAHSLGKLIVAHCELNELLGGTAIHDGSYARKIGHRGISSESEWREVERDIELSRKTGCGLHICHISTKESVDLVRQAKREGLDVSCETAPHYLTLCEEDLRDEGGFRMNPPLRSESDKLALLEGIADGTIDMIATDHAPHSAEEKAQSMAKAPFGIVGLETAVALTVTELLEKDVLTPLGMARVMSWQPARIAGLDAGTLQEGKRADIVLADETLNLVKVL